MNTADPVLALKIWLISNPFAVALALLIIIAAVLYLSSRKRSHFNLRGLARCYNCQDANKTGHKVIYQSEATAQAAAHRYRKRFGRQYPYFQPTCGYWHLTSQSPRQKPPARKALP